MHESALAKQILTVVLAEASAAGARRVLRVRGWIAESEALSAEALAFHFSAHALGTPAAGAELAMRLQHVEARCRACDEVYAPEHHLLWCPRCGSEEGDLLSPTGMGIDAVEVAAE